MGMMSRRGMRGAGLRYRMLYMSRRLPRAMWYTSLAPAVANRIALSPRLCRKALSPTVEPWTNDSTSAGSSTTSPKASITPEAKSSPWLGALAVVYRRRRGSYTTTSVNVPPISVATRSARFVSNRPLCVGAPLPQAFAACRRTHLLRWGTFRTGGIQGPGRGRRLLTHQINMFGFVGRIRTGGCLEQSLCVGMAG